MEHKDGSDTRQRLLEAAGKLFATRGFNETTTLDICQLANANCAAVNYHFQSKENLYVQVWRHAFERSLVAHPPDGGIATNASAETRLRGRIQALINRMLDPESIELDIVSREMTHPTGLLWEVLHRCVEPLHQGIATEVRTLLGPQATEEDVQLCTMSIHAQCFTTMHKRRHLLQHSENRKPKHIPPWANVKPNALIEHICTFSLAGIRRMRNQRQRQAAPQKETAS